MSDESNHAFEELRRQVKQLRLGATGLALALLATIVWVAAKPPSSREFPSDDDDAP